jgi:tRNA (mo5U34)-methyltransferase
MAQDLQQLIDSVPWYHTIDLGNGLSTPGAYDHRPYLPLYGLPTDLSGKTALDIGSASGFFSFELERRGAAVTAVDLPTWDAHDFGPNYQPDLSAAEADIYLTQPFEIAHRALNSTVQKKYMTVYDVTPDTVGMHDLVFCGSLLIHLTDPIQALWNIARVTQELAIIATPIVPDEPHRPIATLVGHERGDGWWLPTRTCLELMALSAGFGAIEWHSEFRLDFRDGSPGPYHGVLHAFKDPARRSPRARLREEILAGLHQPAPTPTPQPAAAPPQDEAPTLRAEIARLNALVQGYEQGRFIRFTKWLHSRLSGQTK